MARHNSQATLSIANGQTKSSSLQAFWPGHSGGTPGTPGTGHPAVVALDNAVSITIKAPAALTGTVTIQVAFTEPSADADFGNFQSGGADLTIAAGKTITFTAPGIRDLRLISSLAEGAQRDFIVVLQEDFTS